MLETVGLLTKDEKEMLVKLGVQHVTILHTRDPLVANTETFAAPFLDTEATAQQAQQA